MLHNPKDHEAVDFLQPELFVTAYDTNHDYAKAQYRKGLDIGSRAAYVSISIYGTWSAQMKNGGSMSSYEKIGYHIHTAELLRGFIHTGVMIKVFRDTTEGIIETVL